MNPTRGQSLQRLAAGWFGRHLPPIRITEFALQLEQLPWPRPSGSWPPSMRECGFFEEATRAERHPARSGDADPALSSVDDTTRCSRTAGRAACWRRPPAKPPCARPGHLASRTSSRTPTPPGHSRRASSRSIRRQGPPLPAPARWPTPGRLPIRRPKNGRPASAPSIGPVPRPATVPRTGVAQTGSR
jgi:hypothetical protein